MTRRKLSDQEKAARAQEKREREQIRYRKSKNDSEFLIHRREKLKQWQKTYRKKKASLRQDYPPAISSDDETETETENENEM